MTQSITGKFARGIKNKLLNFLDGEEQFSFPIQHYATTLIRSYAKKNLEPEYASLWCGAHFSNIKIISLLQLLELLELKYTEFCRR